jgi:hypothetical protein
LGHEQELGRVAHRQVVAARKSEEYHIVARLLSHKLQLLVENQQSSPYGPAIRTLFVPVFGVVEKHHIQSRSKPFVVTHELDQDKLAVEQMCPREKCTVQSVRAQQVVGHQALKISTCYFQQYSVVDLLNSMKVTRDWMEKR